MHHCLRLVLCAAFVLTAWGAAARPLAPEDLPYSLRPWVKWVLADGDARDCPYLYNRTEERRCAWPAPLRLDLQSSGGDFSFGWQVYIAGWVTLPGNREHWPQDITVDGEPASLLERNERPSLWLEPGGHDVSGRFLWPGLPQALSVPADTGLVQLTLDGQPVPFPVLGDDGRLWLAAHGGPAQAGDEADRMTLQVFRRITDEIPLQVTTRIELDVAGRPRETVLRGAVLREFVPLALQSPLPARLEPDGGLRVQLRAGHWTIEVTARHPGTVTALALPESAAPWPKAELWAFEARNHLRLVEVQGLPQIDPRQTSLPEVWHAFPAYRIAAGETLRLHVVRRGDPQPEPDRLTLTRQLWLDFNGSGYTFNDQIGGTMTTGWRLAVNAPLQLGRAAVEGQPRLITQAPGDTRHGVEVRRGAVDLNADSRYEGNIRRLSAVGWDHDFQQVGATLHLPPGWRLVGVGGVDDKRTTGAWLHRWTLLDLFLVLIAAVAVARLWDAPSALLALLTLALIWYEPGAPRYVWLNLIAAIALLRVLPEGKLRALAGLYRTAVLIALVVITVPFMVNQVRTALFPQLEFPWQSVTKVGRAEVTTAPPASQESAPAAPEVGAVQDMAEDAISAEPEAKPSPRRLAKELAREAYDYSVQGGRSLNYQEIDPKANVQTGPGLPRWTWTVVPLNWHGPVDRDQTLRLLLLSPRQHLLVKLLSVAFVALLAAALLRASLIGLRRRSAANGAVATLAMIAISGALALIAPRVEADEFPSPELLNELRTRLLAAPDCAPVCAHSPRLRLSISGEILQLRQEIHAQESVAVPLAGDQNHWLPADISVDGVAVSGVARVAGAVWLSLAPGAHQVVSSGPLSSLPSVQLPLPLKPMRVEIESAEGWRVDGVRADGTAEAQLLLTRENGTGSAATPTQPGTLPAFARVERTLRLGLDWRVETRIVRLSAPDSAIVLEVPLLEGESVTTDNIDVRGGTASVSLPAHAAELVFHSVLERRGGIKLTAPQTTGWVEVWRADVSPVLHARLGDEIPVVHHQASSGNWLPEWRPWPGESVTLTIMRPEGVTGRTFTVDASSLLYTPGERATEVTLNLDLRSSRGGQFTLTLPEQAELQTTTINGVVQPVRQQERLVTLPLTPGAQNANLLWREPRGVGARYRTSAVDLTVPSVNASVQLNMPVERWVLFTRGPLLGPAVMFWGEVIVIVLIAAALARIPLAPLGFWQWLLLGIGLSQVPITMALIVVAWLLALGWRARMPADLGKARFNGMQIVLMLLTVAAAYCLYTAVRQGLLGLPDMQIGGNQSTAQQLNWYQDHVPALLPQGSVLSVPLIAYHLLMLAWALWLAFALVKWLYWGWRCYSTHGLWRPIHLFTRRDRVPQQAPTLAPS